MVTFEKRWGASLQSYLERFGVNPEDVMHGRSEYPLERFGADLTRAVLEWGRVETQALYLYLGQRGEESGGQPGPLLLRSALAVVVCEAHDLGYASFWDLFPDLSENYYEMCAAQLLPLTNLLTAYHVGWAYRGTGYGLCAREAIAQVYAHMGQVLRPAEARSLAAGD